MHIRPILYSLYDALVSIRVPSDKVWAVVDARERPMGTALTPKQDFKMRRVASDPQLENLMRHLDFHFALLDRRFEIFELRLTLRLGLIMFVGFGLIIAAIALWG
jgi:hypothetical protein